MSALRTELCAKLLVCVAAVFLSASSIACRKSANRNSNSNTGSSSATAGDPEQAKRQAQTLVDEGKELYKNDQDEQAAEKFKQAIVQDANNAEAHLRLGMSYAALEKKDDAEAEYKKSIELFKKRQSDSKDGNAAFLLGEAHSFLHQDEDAVRAYRQATKLTPEDEEAWYRLGMAETRLAQYPEAISAFQKALELDPNDSRASDGLENAQEGAQRIKEGKKHAEDMLKKQQENANANGNLNSNSGISVKPTPRRTPPRKPW
ncbi:MAG TPA: tetratricopeptide repeat protein [Verrucomicrobiae bacterium]|jgi:tetratricopeptide (TPR) repeat protein